MEATPQIAWISLTFCRKLFNILTPNTLGEEEKANDNSPEFFSALISRRFVTHFINLLVCFHFIFHLRLVCLNDLANLK